MKKYLNTLYVTTQGCYLRKERETLVVEHEGKKIFQVPIHGIGNIVCFGNVLVSPFLLGFCAANHVGLAFFTEYGRYLGRVIGPQSGNILLRRRQYRMADEEREGLKLVKSFLAAKIGNSRAVLMRALRNHELEAKGKIQSAVDRLAYFVRKLHACEHIDVARGIEGEAAGTYFEVFDHLILQQKADFFFNGRNRRPPMDRVNCLLSFAYALVTNDIEAALQGVGLDPSSGFLHVDRPGRASLALDMVEEFRAFFADRLILNFINLRQVDGSGFEISPNGSVELKEDTRKTFLAAYQKRKQEEVVHPFLGEKVPTGLLFHVQSLLLARMIRGDMEYYPAYSWK